ncbi:MAG: hypothetical protein CFE38_19700 [Comamonadaceae bacterium PBBC1]|nr:MAG: hypothetical protein CFE38_19700 [Comamonadaceae bacterium PBBC1]
MTMNISLLRQASQHINACWCYIYQITGDMAAKLAIQKCNANRLPVSAMMNFYNIFFIVSDVSTDKVSLLFASFGNTYGCKAIDTKNKKSTPVRSTQIESQANAYAQDSLQSNNTAELNSFFDNTQIIEKLKVIV